MEHAFGRLKGRWRCLLKRNDTTMKYIIQQTAACCILHNLCEMQEEEFEEDWRVELDMDNDQFNGDGNAENIRNALKGMLELQRQI